ncbi:MAG: antitoxin [Solirubrobacteraceae bacterium]
MSKRLQVLLDETELRGMREVARRQGMTLSEWVRTTLREARRSEPRGDLGGKLRAVRDAARHDFPTADIDAMLAEIEHGYHVPVLE